MNDNKKINSKSKQKNNKGLIGIIICFIILGIVGFVINKNYNKINNITTVQMKTVQL